MRTKSYKKNTKIYCDLINSFNLSQTQVAKIFNCTRSSVSIKMKGGRKVKDFEIMHLLELLTKKNSHQWHTLTKLSIKFNKDIFKD